MSNYALENIHFYQCVSFIHYIPVDIVWVFLLRYFSADIFDDFEGCKSIKDWCMAISIFHIISSSFILLILFALLIERFCTDKEVNRKISELSNFVFLVRFFVAILLFFIFFIVYLNAD